MGRQPNDRSKGHLEQLFKVNVIEIMSFRFAKLFLQPKPVKGKIFHKNSKSSRIIQQGKGHWPA